MLWLYQPGQAHRAGLWLIKTELLETQTVDFSVVQKGFAMYRAMSLKSAMMTMPDQHRRARAGGKQPDATLTLDREITLPSSGTTLISLADGQGNPVSVEVSPSPTA